MFKKGLFLIVIFLMLFSMVACAQAEQPPPARVPLTPETVPDVTCEVEYHLFIRVGDSVLYEKTIPYTYVIYKALEGRKDWSGGIQDVTELNAAIEEANAAIKVANEGLSSLYPYGDDLPKPQFALIGKLADISQGEYSTGWNVCDARIYPQGNFGWDAPEKKGYTISHRIVDDRMWVTFARGESNVQFSYPIRYLEQAFTGSGDWEIIHPVFDELATEAGQEASDEAFLNSLLTVANNGKQVASFQFSDNNLETHSVLSSVLNWGVYLQTTESPVAVAVVTTGYTQTHDWAIGSMSFNSNASAEYSKWLFRSETSIQNSQSAEGSYAAGTKELVVGNIYIHQRPNATGK